MGENDTRVDEIQLDAVDDAKADNPLVAKAATFLNHPSVQGYKLDDKVKFLRKKGLQESDIEAALKLASSSEVGADSFVSEFGPNPASAPLEPPKWGGSAHLRQQLQVYQNVGTFCLVFGGIAYVGYKVYKEFIEPFMFPERRRTFELTMVSFLEKTNQSMQQLHTTLERINLSLESQQHSSTGLQQSVRELKAELASVKSLFLSRAQFPAAPMAGGVSPSIPSWQLKAGGAGGGPVGDVGRYDSTRREEGRKGSRSGSGARRNASGSDNTGNSSEESLEIIPSGGGNRALGGADYPASSPSPPADDRPSGTDEKGGGGGNPGGAGDL